MRDMKGVNLRRYICHLPRYESAMRRYKNYRTFRYHFICRLAFLVYKYCPMERRIVVVKFLFNPCVNLYFPTEPTAIRNFMIVFQNAHCFGNKINGATIKSIAQRSLANLAECFYREERASRRRARARFGAFFARPGSFVIGRQ